ncbi:hypothetical protein [Natrinema halophilum]|uniref:Uncharacterized protein n=1 Tax=Natrinema halophilum TaxID=1699371 RepID=A0A7D5GLN9_9EURY|nr:hypothetical protein [Natrinema halophilum]QLG49512.1 hypothetical protein HYG82_11890 [Natrinema halophilum]
MSAIETTGLPIVTLVTGLATLISPSTLFERLGLIVVAGYLTCVAVTITPAIGMAFPRFSGNSVEQRRDVIPPRMSAVLLQGVLTIGPGAALAGLVVAPESTHAVLVGSFVLLPALLLRSLATVTGGAFATLAEWSMALAERLAAVDLIHLQLLGCSALLLGGALIPTVSYRHAIARFDRHTVD